MKRKSCIASEADLRWINKADGMEREERVRTCNARVMICKKDRRKGKKKGRWGEKSREMVKGEIAKAAPTVCIYYQLLC